MVVAEGNRLDARDIRLFAEGGQPVAHRLGIADVKQQGGTVVSNDPVAGLAYEPNMRQDLVEVLSLTRDAVGLDQIDEVPEIGLEPIDLVCDVDQRRGVGRTEHVGLCAGKPV